MNAESLGSKYNGDTLHDGSTVHVDGGSKRNGKRRNLLGNTHLFGNGVNGQRDGAFEVAVEKANAITGKNFFINLTGFSPVNSFKRIW